MNPSIIALPTRAAYVAYYRVSTKAQGNSGLEAQRAAVAGFVKGVILAEFTEVESGKNNRRALSMALAYRSAGKNLVQIAQALNEAGFRTARGCAFQATQVRRLLKRG